MLKPIYLFSLSTHPDTININSLEIRLLNPKINFEEYDYLIATSKQIARVLKQYTQEYKAKKVLCISNATAKSIEAIGCEVLEIGSGYGDNLGRIIEKYPRERKWLYLRAEKVASNFVQESQEKGFLIDEAIVYESRCSKAIVDFTLSDEATLIFTSPSSVKCFSKAHTFLQTHTIVVIGESTKKALPTHIQCRVAKSMSIDSCVAVAKNL